MEPKRYAQDPNGPAKAAGPDQSMELLLWHYVERINAGQRIDAAEVYADSPENADEILEQLEAFQSIDTELNSSEPLGTLGDYTLRREIGRGGMGVVYEAWENSMDRAVALKVLPTGAAADEKTFQRFMREARTAGMLSHPNVVTVHGVGIKERTPYYAMEYVEGETLAQIVGRLKETEEGAETVFGDKDGAGYFEKIGKAFADVADGLQHAHSKGVIHRDIKPSNVILDGDGTLRILDFGLARLEGQETLTLTGDVIGTLRYMSPEQVRRRQIPVDHRTDVYSLGATMYEAVCARPPFQGKDQADTLSQIIECDPRPIQQSNPKVPVDLQTIVLKCLRKDAAERYGTAEALAQDLRRFLRGDPIEARPRTSWERVAGWVGRHRTGVALTAVLLVMAAAGLAVSTALVARERNTAMAARDRATHNLYLARIRLAQRDWETGQLRRLTSSLEEIRPRKGEPDRRGWEWYYLLSLCHRDLRTLDARSGPVRAMDWSPNGSLIASGYADSNVRIWNVTTGREHALLTPGEETELAPPGALDVEWSPDGRRVAGALNKRVLVWDAMTQERLASLPHQGQVWSVSWSPDGQRLAASDSRGEVRVWDAVSAQVSRTFSGEGDLVRCVAWSPCGRKLAAGGNLQFRRVWIWDVASGRELHAFRAPAITSISWSGDGLRLAAGTLAQTVLIWDTETGELERVLSGNRGAVHSVSWHPGGDRLASGGDDGVLRVWDTDNVADPDLYRGHRGPSRSVDWSPDGGLVASGSADGTVKVWRVSDHREAVDLSGRSHVCFSPDGRYLATGSPESRTTRILEVSSGRKLLDLSGDHGSLAWHAGGELLAVASSGRLKVWRIPAGELVFSARADDKQTRSVNWSPDGRHLATGGSDGLAKIWELGTEEPLRVFEGHTDTIGSVVWSPDGRRLASGCFDQDVMIWDAADGRVLRVLRRYPDNNWAWGASGQHNLSWSPNGQQLAAGGSAGDWFVWDCASWTELQRVRGHTSNVRGVSWSPDGFRLATASEDGTVRVWEVGSGSELLELKVHAGRVDSVVWSPDGKRLAAAGSTGTRIWDASVGYTLEKNKPVDSTEER